MTKEHLVRTSRIVLTSQVLHRTNRAGVKRVSADSFSLDDDYFGNDIPLKRPPTILLISGILSVFSGTCVGVYGIVTAATASNAKEYLLGLSGYFLTALFPIVFLQIVLMKHTSALALNQEEPYDSYAGQQLQSKLRKVVLLGLISAGLSIWVFFLPLAERFAS